MNRVALVGRLTGDPELREIQAGNSLVSFTLAVNTKFSKEEQADFISCVAWNQTAEFMANYLHKGALISVEGSLQSRNYEDSDGKKVYVLEVVANGVNGLEPKGNKLVEVESNEPILDIDSDDLPF